MPTDVRNACRDNNATQRVIGRWYVRQEGLDLTTCLPESLRNLVFESGIKGVIAAQDVLRDRMKALGQYS